VSAGTAFHAERLAAHVDGAQVVARSAQARSHGGQGRLSALPRQCGPLRRVDGKRKGPMSGPVRGVDLVGAQNALQPAAALPGRSARTAQGPHGFRCRDRRRDPAAADVAARPGCYRRRSGSRGRARDRLAMASPFSPGTVRGCIDALLAWFDSWCSVLRKCADAERNCMRENPMRKSVKFGLALLAGITPPARRPLPSEDLGNRPGARGVPR
jgi:hypothetical protein